MRASYVRNALKHAPEGYVPTAEDIAFLAEDTNTDAATVEDDHRRAQGGLEWHARTRSSTRTAPRGLTDEELEARFWELAQEVVDPLVELARTHTSPSIERSVLMRMGIDSLTCHGRRGRVRAARAARPRGGPRGAR